MPLILIIIGFVLIICNYRAIKRENKVKKENNELSISFQSVLQDSKEESNDYKIEIGLLRRDIAESLTELQEEIIEIKNNLKKLKNNEKIYENKEDLENENFLDEYNIDDNENYDYNKENHKKVGSNKTENIKNLLKAGLTEEEICLKLSVSKGEILLVKGLFKK